MSVDDIALIISDHAIAGYSADGYLNCTCGAPFRGRTAHDDHATHVAGYIHERIR